MTRAPKRSPAQKAQELVFASSDNSITFWLSPSPHGALVRRQQARPNEAFVSTTILVRTRVDLERLQSADTMRFDHPLLYEQFDRACLRLLEDKHG